MGKEEQKEKIKLSIGILVSNHKDYIRRAMEAIKPLLDAVPSELIVLDTKGEETDGSIDIVREYTDKIYPFIWCNDFSAARNACLSYAQGEWFLYQDDDEWFDDVQEFIDFFSGEECEIYNSGYYYTKDYDANGNYSMGIASRIIRRTESTKFIGNIHETYNEFPEPSKFFSCFTHHMGYMYTTLEMKKQKCERNLNLLYKALKEEGYTPRICAQLVQQLLADTGTIKEGLNFAETALEKLNKKGQIKDSCAQWILSAMVRGYALLDDYKGMLACVDKIRKEYRRSRFAELVIAAEVARAAYLKEEYAEVLEHVEAYLEQREWLENHKKEANSLAQMNFPTYCLDEYFFGILYIAAVSANRMEDYQRAMKYWTRFPWKKEGFNAKPYWEEMQVTKKGLKKNSRELIKSDIKLTIGILVSNRIKYIRKSMEALKPLMEAVPCELIAVDTKGEEGDGSIDIVREYTDKIYPFTWCNDFAAARNVCMDHARGEWFMYQDDDEWFDDVQELIDFFNSGECEKYNSAFYYTRDYDIMGNASRGVVGRMIRRRENTCFVGKIHESFNEVFAPCKQLQCFVHHMGYAFFTEEDKKQHQNRNVTLLREELERNGYTPRMCAQMIQELLIVEDTAEEGLEFAKKSLKELEKQNMINESFSQWIFVAIIRYYAIYETYDQLKEQVKEIQNTYQLSEMAKLVTASIMINEAKDNKDEENILANVNYYIQNWNWLQANPEEAMMQSQLDFPKYYTEECYYDVLSEGAKVENARGNYKKAMTYWDQMPWKEEGFDGSRYFAEFQVTCDGYKAILGQVQQAEKQIRKEIMELKSLLDEAKPLVRQYLLDGKKQEAIELLAGMQEMVIAIGKKVESLFGENAPQIHVLEDGCELLWQCANEEEQGQALNLLDKFYGTFDKI